MIECDFDVSDASDEISPKTTILEFNGWKQDDICPVNICSQDNASSLDGKISLGYVLTILTFFSSIPF